jgi:hypothetical protein
VARCRFIDAEKASEGNPAGHSVVFLCRVLGVPRSTYYAHRASRPARTVRERAGPGYGEYLNLTPINSIVLYR